MLIGLGLVTFACISMFFGNSFDTAKLNNKSIVESITIAQKLASIKLQNIGRLPDNIDLNSSLKQFIPALKEQDS